MKDVTKKWLVKNLYTGMTKLELIERLGTLSYKSINKDFPNGTWSVKFYGEWVELLLWFNDDDKLHLVDYISRQRVNLNESKRNT